jgi:hypothetical protein
MFFIGWLVFLRYYFASAAVPTPSTAPCTLAPLYIGRWLEAWAIATFDTGKWREGFPTLPSLVYLHTDLDLRYAPLPTAEKTQDHIGTIVVALMVDCVLALILKHFKRSPEGTEPGEWEQDH